MLKNKEVVEKSLFSEEVECNVLGCILVSEDCYKFIKRLEIEDFYVSRNKLIFKAIKELFDKKREINVLSVKEELKNYNQVDVLEYLVGLTDLYITSSIMEQSVNILKNYSTRRKLKNAVLKILDRINTYDIYQDSAEIKQDAVKDILDIKTESVLEVKNINSIMSEATADIEKNYKHRNDDRYKTGFFDLDKLTNGLHEQELTVIAARPGVGKTSIALNIAEEISKYGVCTYFVSLEMSDKQLGNRLIASRSGIDSHILRCGWLEDKDFEKIGNTADEISKWNLIIDSKCNTIQDIENKAIELKEKSDIGLLIIDYLQLLKSNNRFDIREREVAEISRK